MATTCDTNFAVTVLRWLTIVLPCWQVEGYMYSMGTNRMRMRMFHTQQDVHPNHIFCPVVTAPSSSADYKPRVDWSKFHEVIALEEDELKSPHLECVSKAWGALSSKPVIFGNACLSAARPLTVLA